MGQTMNLNCFLRCAPYALVFVCLPPAVGQLTFNFVDSAGDPAIGNPNIAPEAVAGFVAAGERWSDIFDDNITVNIEIGFDPIPSITGATILGSTGSTLVDSPADLMGMFPTFESLKDQLTADATSENDFIAIDSLPVGNEATNGPTLRVISFLTNDRDGNIILDGDTSIGGGDFSGINNTLFAITNANAKAIGLLPGTAPAIDAFITFNSTIDFDFDPSNGITPGTTDFVGVATHEIGHALGFISGVDTVDIATGAGPSAGADINGAAPGIGDLNGFALFSTLDLFRRSEAAFAADPDAFDFTVRNGAVFFSIDGDLSDGDDVLMETGSFNGTGNQASHFLDGFPPRGILDPTAGPGELLVISENDITAFDVIGYDLIDTVDGVLGDFNGDSDVDLVDLDQYNGNIGADAVGDLAALDLDGNGTVDAADFELHFSTLVETSSGVAGTFAGDADLDGTVDVIADAFALVSNLGSTVTSWSQGDFNADGEVNIVEDAIALVSNLGNSNTNVP